LISSPHQLRHADLLRYIQASRHLGMQDMWKSVLSPRLIYYAVVMNNADAKKWHSLRLFAGIV